MTRTQLHTQRLNPAGASEVSEEADQSALKVRQLLLYNRKSCSHAGMIWMTCVQKWPAHDKLASQVYNHGTIDSQCERYVAIFTLSIAMSSQSGALSD